MKIDPVSAVGGVFIGIVAALAFLIATQRLILTDFFRWRRRVPRGFVIVINGGSGVGKTTLAWALARKLGVAPVLCTDFVRETLRHKIPKDIQDEKRFLHGSSFFAHHYLSDELPERERVVEGFRSQTLQIVGPIVDIINRVRTKRDPIIIEGINVLATELFHYIPNDPTNAIFFINLHMESQDKHVTRLRDRGADSSEPPELTDRYVHAISNIRTIDKFLKEDTGTARTTCALNVISIENSGTLHRALGEIDRAIRNKLKLITHRRPSASSTTRLL